MVSCLCRSSVFGLRSSGSDLPVFLFAICYLLFAIRYLLFAISYSVFAIPFLPKNEERDRAPRFPNLWTGLMCVLFARCLHVHINLLSAAAAEESTPVDEQ